MTMVRNPLQFRFDAPLSFVALNESRVQVALEAWSSFDPALALELSVALVPRRAMVDGQERVFDIGRTLNPRCWTESPQRIMPLPRRVAELVDAFGAGLDRGLSVLALYPSRHIDPAVIEAFKARTVLLSSHRRAIAENLRVAVVELPIAGTGLAFLAEQAARAAIDGMGLHQIITLIERLQDELRVVYLAEGAPHAQLIHPESERFVWPGSQALWVHDPASGQLKLLAQGRRLADRMFAEGEPLHDMQPVRGSGAKRLLRQVHAGRVQAGLSGIAAYEDLVGFRQIFPVACLELLVLPEERLIAQMSALIQRIDQPPAPPLRGVLQRGGF
jgi:hypothetical protein